MTSTTWYLIGGGVALLYTAALGFLWALCRTAAEADKATDAHALARRAHHRSTERQFAQDVLNYVRENEAAR